MIALTTPAPFPVLKRAGVLAAAGAFVVATIWQVSTQRDDWPLSCFEMYSGLEGDVSSRSVVKGVSDQGEFDLTGEMLPFGGARLRHLNAKLARNRGRQRQFIELVQQRYDDQRQAQGWPVLQAVRSYSETWTIRPELVGIDKPKRRVSGSLYFLPLALGARLEQERAGSAPVAAPERVPSGDVVLEPSLPSGVAAAAGAGAATEPAGGSSAQSCGRGCTPIDDRYAADGRAVRLQSAAESALMSWQATLGAGHWALFVRVRTPASGGTDRFRVWLDGKRVGGDAGNYAKALGTGAWLWASSSPGDAPLRLEIATAGEHNIVLKVADGALDIDQIWLSQTQKELPVHSDPVQP